VKISQNLKWVMRANTHTQARTHKRKRAHGEKEVNRKSVKVVFEFFHVVECLLLN
jgi:hypothetical protein